MNKLKIVLAEDHGVVRDGLRLLIDAQDDLEVVGEAGDGRQALEIITRLQPHVAVVDVSMPIMNGIELMSRLAEMPQTTKVLILTANEDRAYMQTLFSLGAIGYLLKRSAAEELIRAIRTVAQGVRYLDPTILDELVGRKIENPADAVSTPPATLSEREHEVLRLIAQGFTNKEIAAQLEISIKTVETYKSRSMQKLGLRGRADIVRFAMDRGWLRDL